MMKAVANLSTAQSRFADSDSPPTSQRARLQRKCACGKIAAPEGECDECRKKRLHSKEQNPEIGQSMTHGFMESRSVHDFSKVRVFSDTRAAESTRDVNAIAYPVARDGGIGKGQFPPGKSISSMTVKTTASRSM